MDPLEDGFQIATEMIEDIKKSDFGSAEKVLLSIEWILREYRPYELYNMKPAAIRKIIEQCLQHNLTSNLIKSALDKVRETFEIQGDEKALTLLIALAYFLYIDNEFVYDKEMREEMLSKERELGFPVSEVERHYEKWKTAFGDPADLFQRLS